MRPRLRANLLILPVALASACASNGSTFEIYHRILGVRLYGFACDPGARRGPDARLQRLRPWLEAELGAAELADSEALFRQDEATLDLISCPDADDVRQSRLAYFGLLRELERRSRRHADRRSGSAAQ